MAADTTGPVPQRSNSRRNRERILQIAQEALRRSSDASINSIAKEADVGIATVFRHFPTREALVLEVYRREMRQAVDAAPKLLAELPPLEALREWMGVMAKYAMTKQGLADALGSRAAQDAIIAEAYPPILGAIGLILKAGQSDGSIRPGLTAEDFFLAMHGMWRIDPHGNWRQQAQMLTDILVAGIDARRLQP
jgi:AcrR family transcriptional regulator